MFFSHMMAIAAFDFFETSEFISDLLDLLPRDPINEKFESIGFETVYFMNNLGTFILVLAFWAILALLWIILYPLQSCSMWLRERQAKLRS